MQGGDNFEKIKRGGKRGGGNDRETIDLKRSGKTRKERRKIKETAGEPSGFVVDLKNGAETAEPEKKPEAAEKTKMTDKSEGLKNKGEEFGRYLGEEWLRRINAEQAAKTLEDIAAIAEEKPASEEFLRQADELARAAENAATVDEQHELLNYLHNISALVKTQNRSKSAPPEYPSVYPKLAAGESREITVEKKMRENGKFKIRKHAVEVVGGRSKRKLEKAGNGNNGNNNENKMAEDGYGQEFRDIMSDYDGKGREIMLDNLLKKIKQDGKEEDLKLAAEIHKAMDDLDFLRHSRLAVHGRSGRDRKTGEVILHETSDLDGAASVWLLKTFAGNREDLKYVHPGDHIPGRHNIDTGDKLGIVREGETSWGDHHAPDAPRDTSSFKEHYQYLLENDKIKLADKVYLDKFVDFVTMVDNADYDVPKDYWQNFHRTVLGIKSRVNGSNLNKLVNFFRAGKHGAFDVLSDEELKQYDFTGESKQVEETIKKAETELERMDKAGMIVDSKHKDYGRIAVDINGRVKAYDAARAFGCETYINWNPENQSFFISTRKPLKAFEGLPGKRIREQMWIKPLSDTGGLNITLKELLTYKMGVDAKDINKELRSFTTQEISGRKINATREKGEKPDDKTLNEYFGNKFSFLMSKYRDNDLELRGELLALRAEMAENKFTDEEPGKRIEIALAKRQRAAEVIINKLVDRALRVGKNNPERAKKEITRAWTYNFKYIPAAKGLLPEDVKIAFAWVEERIGKKAEEAKQGNDNNENNINNMAQEKFPVQQEPAKSPVGEGVTAEQTHFSPDGEDPDLGRKEEWEAREQELAAEAKAAPDRDKDEFAREYALIEEQGYRGMGKKIMLEGLLKRMKDAESDEDRALREEISAEARKLGIEHAETLEKATIDLREKERPIPPDMLAKFKNEFGVSREELENIAGFDKLSDGQRLLALENLRQWILGAIQTKAREAHRRGEEGLGLFGKIRHNFLKGNKIQKLEYAVKEDVIAGKYKNEIKTLLNDLTKKTQGGPEVIVREKNGRQELETEYVSPDLDGLAKTAEEKRMVADFNLAATAYGRMPSSWGSETHRITNEKEHRRYHEAKKKYEEAKLELSRLVAGKSFEVMNMDKEKEPAEIEKHKAVAGSALFAINEIDRDVNLDQFLNTHPEVEKQLLNIKKRSFINYYLRSAVKSEKGWAFGAGLSSRMASRGILMFLGKTSLSAGTAASFAAAAPVAMVGLGAGFGAWRGKIRGKEDIENKDILSRRKDIGSREEVKQQRKKYREELAALEKGSQSGSAARIAELNTFLRTQETAYIRELNELSGRQAALRKEGRVDIGIQKRIEELNKLFDKEHYQERNFADASGLADKLEALAVKIGAAKNERERQKLVNALKTRINYTSRKLEDGLVNFGENTEIIGNNSKLHSAIGKAIACVGGYKEYNITGKDAGRFRTEKMTKHELARFEELSVKDGLSEAEQTELHNLRKKEEGRSTEERIDDILGLREQKITKAQKDYLRAKIKQGMYFGAGFATAGAAIAHYFGDDIREAAAKLGRPIYTPIKGFVGDVKEYFFGDKAVMDNLAGGGGPRESLKEILGGMNPEQIRAFDELRVWRAEWKAENIISDKELADRVGLYNTRADKILENLEKIVKLRKLHEVAKVVAQENGTYKFYTGDDGKTYEKYSLEGFKWSFKDKTWAGDDTSASGFGARLDYREVGSGTQAAGMSEEEVVAAARKMDAIIGEDMERHREEIAGAAGAVAGAEDEARVDEAIEKIRRKVAAGKEAAAEARIEGRINTFSGAIYEAAKKADIETQENFIHRVLGDDAKIDSPETRKEMLAQAARKLSVANIKTGDGNDVANLVHKGNIVRLNRDGGWEVLKGDGIKEASAVSELDLRRNAAREWARDLGLDPEKVRYAGDASRLDSRSMITEIDGHKVMIGRDGIYEADIDGTVISGKVEAGGGQAVISEHIKEINEQLASQTAIESERLLQKEHLVYLDNLKNQYGIGEEVMQSVGIDQADGFSRPEMAKLDFLMAHSGNLEQAADTIRLADSINIPYHEAFDYYYQLKNVEGNPDRMRGVMFMLNENYQAGLRKIFGVAVDDHNYEFKDGVHRVKDVARHFDLVALVNGGEIKFGVDGPWGKWNWGAGGRDWRCRIDADLTNTNIDEARAEIARMAKALGSAGNRTEDVAAVTGNNISGSGGNIKEEKIPE